MQNRAYADFKDQVQFTRAIKKSGNGCDDIKLSRNESGIGT